MQRPILLSKEEIDLLLVLLKSELRELPVEIHHTGTFEMRHDLREKEKTVSSLIERLEHEQSQSAYAI